MADSGWPARANLVPNPNTLTTIRDPLTASRTKTMTTRQRHIISILLQNEVGALTRVAGLFSTRGYNIESLNVAATDDPTVSRITLVTTGTEQVLQQIVNQSLKLVDVVNVDDMTADAHIERELLLIKLKVPANQLAALRKAADDAHARVLVDDAASFTIEHTDSEAQVSRFIVTVSGHGEVLELVRSGALAVYSGATTLKT
jgi:acetolactate synthase-1/3 small subunit